MNSIPIVTIIVPIYNVEPYIQHCLQSIFDQKYPCIELIAVDDCGTDESISIVKKMFSCHPSNVSCKLLFHTKNRGISAARNTGINAAHGDYLLFVDSDDYILPQCIEKLVARAEETEADVVICDHISDDKAKSRGGHMCAPIQIVEGNEACIHALEQCWFNVTAWCKLLRRSFVEQNKLYFIDGLINEDAPWSFRLTLCANRMAFLKEPLLFYRYNENSIMSASKKQKIIDSNEIALNDFLKAVLERTDLWQSKDVYLLFMRQIVIFYMQVHKYADFTLYYKKMRMLSRLCYKSSWFNSHDVPRSYRVWNVLRHTHVLVAAIVSYTMLKIQNR